ncbi:nucleotidyltransferase domain-containing protein [Candidatus Gottesmanbacteria bacterium]|nr:nucleotidyltransferase domain-containing protein [Candidatus Gottesmanbacteria bacterium]
MGSFLPLQGQFMEELSHLLGPKVDVVNTNASDVAFNYRVLTQGRVLYQRSPEDKLSFQIELVRQYFDLKSTYDLYYRELSHRARTGALGKL